ncbi:hypothetical protein ACGFNX_12775 [Streptomyces sp. NPDC048723]|uniref:hypothetical protein n=1 Tax=Streptomyces sp. NPDC048723 TaxID=3365589 RepID=UPI00371557EC
MAPVRTKRLVASLFLTAAVVITPMAVAAPASAAGRDCTATAKALGYLVGPKVAAACGFPASQPTFSRPWVQPNDSCMTRLANAGISNWNHRFGICIQA